MLGHRIKSEVSRPRELLSLPTLQDLDFDLNDDEGKSDISFSDGNIFV